jgi:hypothetical protein
VRDGLADHWRESYDRETGQSMKAVELGGVGGTSSEPGVTCLRYSMSFA